MPHLAAASGGGDASAASSSGASANFAFWIPHSIIYSFSKAVAWFHTDEASGHVWRRPRSLLTTGTIAEECLRSSQPPHGHPASCAFRAVFLHVAPAAATESAENTYRYLTQASCSSEGLLNMLQTPKSRGVLQHYVYGRQETDGQIRNVAVSCSYTPTSFVAERLVSRHTLSDKTVPMHLRTNFDTFGPADEKTPVTMCERQALKSSLVAEKFLRACEEAARRARVNNGLIVKHMNVYCRVDPFDRLFILYCDALTLASVNDPDLLHVLTPGGVVVRHASAPLRAMGSGDGQTGKRTTTTTAHRGTRHLADLPGVPEHVAALFATSAVAMNADAGARYGGSLPPAGATPHSSTQAQSVAPSSPLGGSRSGKAFLLSLTLSAKSPTLGASQQKHLTRPGTSTTVSSPSPYYLSGRPASPGNAPTVSESGQGSALSLDSRRPVVGGESDGYAIKRCCVCKVEGQAGRMPRVQKRYLLLSLSLLDRNVAGWNDDVPPSVAILHPCISYAEFLILRESDAWLDEFLLTCTDCVARCNTALDNITRQKLRAPGWLNIDDRYRHGHRENSTVKPSLNIRAAGRRLQALVASSHDHAIWLQQHGAPSSTGDRLDSTTTTNRSRIAAVRSKQSSRAPSPATSPRLESRPNVNGNANNASSASSPTLSSSLPQRRGGVQQAARVDPEAADIFDTQGDVWRRVGFGKPRPADAYVPLAPMPGISLMEPSLRDALQKALQRIAPQLDAAVDGDDGLVTEGAQSQFPQLFDLERSMGHCPPCPTPTFTPAGWGQGAGSE
jgi:hypothetical protein